MQNERNLLSLHPTQIIAWFVALFATAASIYFIEIIGRPAAPLCWFERMLMFGVLLLLSVGIVRKDIQVKWYVLPFLLFGFPSAAYQQLVHWGIISVPVTTCSASFVCTTKFFTLYGFITQATLCLVSFLIIACCLFLFDKRKK